MNIPSGVPKALSDREEHYHRHYHRSSSSNRHPHHSNPERAAHMLHSGPHDHSHYNSDSGSRPRPASTAPVAQPTEPSQLSQNHFSYSKCTGRKKALCEGFTLTIGFLSADLQRLDWNQLSRTIP